MGFTFRWAIKAVLALGVSAAVAVIVRLRSNEQVPTQRGVWRELRGPDLR